jgi:hypothetical protein
MVCFFEKVRYRWRRRNTNVQFIVLKLHEIWSDLAPREAARQSKTHQRSKPTRDDGL